MENCPGYGSDGRVIVEGKLGSVTVEGRWNLCDGLVVGSDVVVGDSDVVVVVVTDDDGADGAPPWLPPNSATMPQMISKTRTATTTLNTSTDLRRRGAGEVTVADASSLCAVDFSQRFWLQGRSR